MSRDPIIEEIRRAQNAIRRSRGGAHADPGKTSPAFPAEFAEVIGELFSRLDRTQEHLLRTIAERTTSATTPAPTSSGSAEENAILQEILQRLDQPTSSAAPSAELEGQLEEILKAVKSNPGSARVDLEPISDRLDAIEHRLRNSSSGEGTGSTDLEPITEELRALGKKISSFEMPTVSVEGEPISFDPLIEKLDSIEQRLGGDAGAMTIGAALSRISETLERVETSLTSESTGEASSPIDPAWLTRIEETLSKLADDDEEDSATKAISTLKRDFSLLVHTINGHLQESRHRSEKVETSLDQICTALGPIAKLAGFELAEVPEAEAEPA